MNRPYSLNSARFLRAGTEQDNPRPQTAWERERMSPPFPDARPLHLFGTWLPVLALVLGAATLVWMLVRWWLA